ncbi:hypothetical protein EAG_01430 [Camponotus floridanus]|uniref:Uncharacterized protein n=1 Tax=Camponotus floridanus TaxID=104421 RepID=E2AV15_CAMFO|nr:hypothetical protein EAG_01430 [Camponotus floridanus]
MSFLPRFRHRRRHCRHYETLDTRFDVSHRNANYESPDAIRLSVRGSRLQRQLFVASSRTVRAIVSAPVISVRINVQLEAPSITRAEEQNRPEKARTERTGRRPISATNNIIAVPRKRCVCDREGEAPEDEVFSLYPAYGVQSREREEEEEAEEEEEEETPRLGHIGENPFDNGSWGKEHFQPSTVPWQLNPRGHGRPSKDTFLRIVAGESLLILTPVNPTDGKHRLAGVELSRYTRQHSNTTRTAACLVPLDHLFGKLCKFLNLVCIKQKGGGDAGGGGDGGGSSSLLAAIVRRQRWSGEVREGSAKLSVERIEILDLLLGIRW